MEVRRARSDEFDEAGRATASAWREFADPEDSGWTDYLAKIADVGGRANRTTVLVAVDEQGAILGSATLELERTIGDEDDLPDGRANVRMLGVTPAARGRGAGRALMEACIAESRAGGKNAVTLKTTPRMEAAVALYESMGFERDLEADYHGEDGFVLLGYRLPL